MDIDVGAMITAGDFPANGLIYCNRPVRFYNASDLGGNRLMIASNSTVYTKGDVNTVNKQGMSIMTKHRIYILSDDCRRIYCLNRSGLLSHRIYTKSWRSVPGLKQRI